MESLAMTFLPECPHCGRPNMTFYFVGGSIITRDSNNVNVGTISFWQCSNCQKGVCGESKYGVNNGSAFDYKHFSSIYPAPEQLSAPGFTPEQVASDFIEAVSSLKNGNYKAASIMARTSLEAAVNFFEAEGPKLWHKINNLAERHIITPDLAEWAHEIRDIGNDSAHEGGPITEKDAQDAVDFAEMLYIYLFTLPGRVKKRREKS